MANGNHFRGSGVEEPAALVTLILTPILTLTLDLIPYPSLLNLDT